MLVVVGAVVVAIVGALVVVSRGAGDTAVLRLPVLGPARDIYDGDLGDPFILPVTGTGQETHFVAFGTDATGLAHCATLEGPCTEASDAPVLTNAQLDQPEQFAPGGLETFRDGQGVLWAVFDTWNRPTRNGRFYCCRSLQLAPVRSS